MISFTLLFASSAYLFFVIFQFRDIFTAPFNHKIYEKQYNESQWVIPHSKKPISDETLYSYAGYRYIEGLNPILLNPETPPLGKYLIGLSIKFFNNQRVISLSFALLSLAVLFYLVYTSTASHIQASFAVLLTSTHSLFIDQIIHSPQLDIFQLFFLLILILFFTIYGRTRRFIYLILTGISFGAFVSIKFFLMYYAIVNASFMLFYLLKKERIKKAFLEFCVINLGVFFIYTLTYFQYFILGGTIRSFLGVQKWIALFYYASTIPTVKLIGNYLSLIFFNRWRFWTADFPVIKYQYWSIFWPIIFVLGITSAYKLLKDKKGQRNNLVLLLLSFLIVYNIFLFITPIYPRYLLLLFVPFNILIAIYFGQFFHRKLRNFKF